MAIDNGSGIIINPAAYTFTSLALFDALKMFPGPIIELYISNVHKREAFVKGRHGDHHRSRRERISFGGSGDARSLFNNGVPLATGDLWVIQVTLGSRQ